MTAAVVRPLRRSLPSPPRLARIVIVAVLVGVAVSHVRWMFLDWSLHDMNVYWDAAMRLRTGAPLYAATDPLDVYRYAPWWAYAWVPLTYLPKIVVDVGWSLLLLIASGLATALLLRRATLAAGLAALLFAPLLFAISSIGNVQPLLVLVLAWGIPRRSGPVWIALAASLKAVPLAFVLIYVARREWLRAATAVVLTALLVSPMLLFPIPLEVFSAGRAAHLPTPLWATLALLAVGAAVLLALRRSGWTPLAAAVAAVAALPRLFLYEVALVEVGTLLSDPRREVERGDRSRDSA